MVNRSNGNVTLTCEDNYDNAYYVLIFDMDTKLKA